MNKTLPVLGLLFALSGCGPARTDPPPEPAPVPSPEAPKPNTKFVKSPFGDYLITDVARFDECTAEMEKASAERDVISKQREAIANKRNGPPMGMPFPGEVESPERKAKREAEEKGRKEDDDEYKALEARYIECNKRYTEWNRERNKVVRRND